MDVFIGTVFPWAVTWAPYGYHLCDGSMLTINQYQAVYSLVGTFYGQTASTNFGIPDLRGRTMIGSGIPVNQSINYVNGQVTGAVTSSISAANLPNHVHAATFAPTTAAQAVTIPGKAGAGTPTATVTFDATTNNTIAAPSPVNTVATPTAAGPNYLGSLQSGKGAAFYTTLAPSAGNTAPISGVSATVSTAGYTPTIPDNTVNLNLVNGGAVSVQPGGGASSPQGISTMQPSLVMGFIITLQGLYPSRD